MRHPGKEEEEGGLCQGSLLARARLVSQVRCGGHVCYHDGVTPGPGRGMGHRTPGFLEEAHVTSPDAISSPCCWAELCRAGQNPRVHPDTRPWHPERGQSWWRQWGQPLGSAWGGDGSPPEFNIPSLGGWDPRQPPSWPSHTPFHGELGG